MFLKLNTMNFVIVLLTFITMTYGYSLSYMPNFNMKNTFDRIDNNKKNFDSVFDLMTQKENYCFMATISNQKNIEGYPYGSVMGYSLNEQGFPILGLSSISRHSKNIQDNKSVSIVILEKKIQNIFQKRVVLTGNLKKIENEIMDDYKIPSELTTQYKEIYMKSHPDALWIDFPDVNMYVLDDIKDIFYIGGFAKADKLNVDVYIDYLNNNYNM